MSTPSGAGDTVTADIDLAIGSRRLRTRLNIPVVPMPPSGLLPIARAVTDAAVAAAVEDAAALGRSVTCRAGCAACCRQLVPVTEVEAWRLAEVVEAMPEPRRSEVRERFASACERLAQAGLLEELRDSGTWKDGSLDERGLEYFHLGVPCPFLEDESCSIYAERPLVCREYMVVSPVERCLDPRPREVLVVDLPLKGRQALARATAPTGSPPEAEPWVPLVLALEWSAAHPEPPPVDPGPELVQRLFAQLTGRDIPAPPAQETPCPSRP